MTKNTDTKGSGRSVYDLSGQHITGILYDETFAGTVTAVKRMDRTMWANAAKLTIKLDEPTRDGSCTTKLAMCVHANGQSIGHNGHINL